MHTTAGARPSAQIEEREGVAVVELLGEHDLGTSTWLRDLLDGLVRRGWPVVVSVTRTDFMDCAVLRTLASVDEAARRDERRLVMHFGTSEVVRRLFEVTGFLDGRVCSPDLEQALALARPEATPESNGRA